MRYGYIGYTQVLDGDRISTEKVLKRKQPDPEIKLSKQISSLMKTALYQTNESIWRMSPVLPSGMVKLPPARPRGIKQAPNLLASRLSDLFYCSSAEYLLEHWDQLNMDKLADIGKMSRRYGAAWQPIYDLVADDPKTHVKLIKKMLKALGYPVAENFSTVFCFAFVGLKKYKQLVAVAPKLLRPYICLLPATMKEHEVALKWAQNREFIRVALNASLFLEVPGKKEKPTFNKALKLAFRDIKETWTSYYVGVFVPLCVIQMEHLMFLPSLAKKCNVVITDFNPLSGDQYKLSMPKPKPEPLPINGKAKKATKKSKFLKSLKPKKKKKK